MKKIDDETIAKIEQVFRFQMYEWQKEFLKSVSAISAEKGKDNVVYHPGRGRNNGRMFVLSLGLLLGELKEPIDLDELSPYAANYIVDVNEKLVAAGFKTNLIEKEKES